MPRRFEPLLIAVALLPLVFLPFVPALRLDSPRPHSADDWFGFTMYVVAIACLADWRRWPLGALLVGVAAMLAGATSMWEPPDVVLVLLPAYTFLAGDRFTGRSAWLAALGSIAWIQGLYVITGDTSPALYIMAVPGFLAGTVLRLRREAAKALALRSAELEAERELFAQVSVRNERARIAAELHDLIGHALSVMVVQSAAGQRLVDRDPDAASAALTAIAASARQGREDLRRLVELLGGQELAAPDLSLIDELVGRAAGSGLAVTCRFEGDRDGVSADLAHVAFRVVQEGLTNAMRYAPGAAVRVLVRGSVRHLDVEVENDPARHESTGIRGGGIGILGLRERVRELGGSLSAGPTPSGGWRLAAAFGAG